MPKYGVNTGPYFPAFEMHFSRSVLANVFILYPLKKYIKLEHWPEICRKEVIKIGKYFDLKITVDIRFNNMFRCAHRMINMRIFPFNFLP